MAILKGDAWASIRSQRAWEEAQAVRLSPEELEALRPRVLELRARGYSYNRIALAIGGVSSSWVRSVVAASQGGGR